MTICVYALIGRTRARLDLAGITGEPVRAIAAGDIAAVAGEVRSMPAPSIRNLRRYAAVIEALTSRVPAVLPARFGTVVADPAELRFILGSRAGTFRAGLRHVRGRCQMTIHMFPESEYGVGVRSRSTKSEYEVDGVGVRALRGTYSDSNEIQRTYSDSKAVRSICEGRWQNMPLTKRFHP